MPSQPHSPLTAKAPQEPVGQVDTPSVVVRRKNFYSPRNALCVIFAAVSLLIFWTPLRTVLHFPIFTDNAYDKYCYTVIVPFLSLAILFLERRGIFSSPRYCIRAGMPLLLAAVFLRLIAGQVHNRIGVDNTLSIELLGLVIFWIGDFILCYGTSAFRTGLFPLLLLFLTVPIPDFLLDEMIRTVQYGSAAICSFVFSLFRVPVLRDGMVFTLPDLSIRVEKACSGIHSTMAILLVSLLAAHLFLTPIWKKLFLVLFAIPIVCITNGLRIALLTLLAQYVDRSFLYGGLHHQGGVGFFALALLLLYATLLLLKIRTP